MEAAQALPEGEQPPVDEIIVAGGAQLDLFGMGGKKPTHAVLTLRGGAYKLKPGEGFEKGTTIHFSGTAVVREAGDLDITDSKTQQVVDCKRKHFAQITDLAVSPATKPEVV